MEETESEYIEYFETELCNETYLYRFDIDPSDSSALTATGDDGWDGCSDGLCGDSGRRVIIILSIVFALVGICVLFIIGCIIRCCIKAFIEHRPT